MEEINTSVTENKEGDFDLDLILRIVTYLRTRVKIIAAGALIGAVLGFVLSSFVLTPKYRAFIDLYVTNNSSTDAEAVNINDLNASQKLVSTYIVMLQANTVTDKVTEAVDPRLTREQLLKEVSFSSVNATEVLRITAETEDAQLSVDICNAYKNIASEVLEDIVGAGSVKVISTPQYPKSPSSPSVVKYTLGGGFLGMLLIIAVALVSMFFDKTVGDEAALRERYSIPLLGTVPDFFQFSRTLGISKRDVKKSRKLKSKNENNEKIFTAATILGSQTPFPITEAYNSIRSNLMFSSELQTGILVVTSPDANDLKTTTSINLAISLTQAGAKVLLIDADLRNPSIHRQFKVGNKQGLSRVLVGYDTLSDAAVHQVQPGLDLLPTGPMPPRPAELLSSSAMIDLLEDCIDSYDFTVIDTSPVNVVSDALAMAAHSDGVLLVARSNKTSYSELDKAIKTISMAKAGILGMVLTDVEIGNGGYGYSYSHYGYGYGQHGAAKAHKDAANAKKPHKADKEHKKGSK